VIATNIIIIMMPVFRGYFISSSADEITHLGMIKDIFLTGFLGDENVYPISHILSYLISIICELDDKFVIKIIPSIFYLLYMVGLYLLASIICKNHSQTLFILAFGSVLLFTYYHYIFLPTQFFLCSFPFLLFLVFRRSYSNDLCDAAILIITIIMMPFLHPLGSAFLVFVFLSFSLFIYMSYFISKKYNVIFDIIPNYYISKIAMGVGALILVTFLAWFINFSLFKHSVKKAYRWFFEGYGTSELIHIADTVNISGLNILQLIDVIIKTYGPSLVFVSLSLVATLILLRNIFRERYCHNAYELFFLILFMMFSFLYFLTISGGFCLILEMSYEYTVGRLVASVVTNGIAFHDLIIHTKERGDINKSRIICIAILALLIITAILGTFSVYPSPHIMRNNLQTTTMDWVGMIWFFDHKNNDSTICFSQLPYRSPHYLYGFSAPKPESVGHFSEIPPHLGYAGNSSLADTVLSDSYIVINEQVRVKKKLLWPYSGTYTIDDLNMMSHDSGVIKMYTSGELDVCYLLHSRHESTGC